MAIDIVDALVILVYLFGIVGVGYYASTRVRSSADYAVAGRSMSFPVFTAMVLIDPSIWQRIAAARSVEDLRPAMFLTAGFFGF